MKLLTKIRKSEDIMNEELKKVHGLKLTNPLKKAIIRAMKEYASDYLNEAHLQAQQPFIPFTKNNAYDRLNELKNLAIHEDKWKPLP